MSSSLWKVFEEMCLRYEARCWVPVKVHSQQQSVRVIHLSQKNQLLMRATSFVLLAHTVYCFLCLCWTLHQWNSSKNQDMAINVPQIFVLFMLSFLPACFITTSFVVSHTAEICPAILNTMSELETRIMGKQ